MTYVTNNDTVVLDRLCDSPSDVIRLQSDKSITGKVRCCEETSWKIPATWGITPEMGGIDRRAVYAFANTVASTWCAGRILIAILIAGDAARTRHCEQNVRGIRYTAVPKPPVVLQKPFAIQ
jgi:2-polyprenyl-6-methoxyphenol hydroxylase-like FAD-dependent oxidoreductase